VARDYYEVLGVSRDADADEIQRAFRTLARRYHPDVNKDPAAEDRFKEINEAYHVLSDPSTRARYDRFGPDFRQIPEDYDDRVRVGAQGGGPRRATGTGVRFNQGYGGGRGGFGGIDLDDLFDGLFSGRAATGSTGPIPGADQEAELSLTVEEAFRGGQRRLTLSSDTGPSREFDVTIPPGVLDGQRIRLAGQGGSGGGPGAPPGDLYLVVRIEPHPRYRLDGRDIHMTLPVAPWEATLGATIAITTPGGEAKVKVPKGTSSGRKLRLRGEGMPNPKGQPGDLIAEIRIMVPTRLSHRERELWEQLAAESSFDPRKNFDSRKP
jgi:curved DNA-binding protein